MSKSKKNTINPEDIIKQYGADSVRFFILADSPPERDVQWSDEGMKSSYKFIQKFWTLCTEIMELLKNDTKENSKDLDIFTNQSINKIDYALRSSLQCNYCNYQEIYS